MPVVGTQLGSSLQLDNWRIDVDPYLNGCPSPVVNEALRKGLREFCRETEVWRETLSTTTVASQTEYPLAPLITSYDGMIQRVYEVRTADNALHSSLYTVDNDRMLTFKSALSAGETLEVDVSMLPTERWQIVSTTLTTEWNDAPKAWALMHLKGMMRTQWADPDGAQYWLDTYRNYVLQAKTLAFDGNHQGNVAVKLRRFV